MSFKREKEAILDVTKGGRCYYLTVRLLIHPISFRLVYLANRLKIHPNYISLTCAFFSIICLYYLYTGYFLMAFLFFYTRMIFDYGDGALARYSSKVSKMGGFLDRVTDEAFFIILWLLIAWKTDSIILGAYFFISVLLYRAVVDIFIYPRLSLLTKRAAIKQFFMSHGIILGCGVFTVLEFWTLFIFSIAVPRYYMIIPVFLCNLDLIYRTYEIIRYARK